MSRPSCRVALIKATHAEDYEGEEIPVVAIDEAPRRLAVAKLFDRCEGGGAFDYFEALTWINPADRRPWRKSRLVFNGTLICGVRCSNPIDDRSANSFGSRNAARGKLVAFY